MHPFRSTSIGVSYTNSVSVFPEGHVLDVVFLKDVKRYEPVIQEYPVQHIYVTI